MKHYMPRLDVVDRWHQGLARLRGDPERREHVLDLLDGTPILHGAMTNQATWSPPGARVVWSGRRRRRWNRAAFWEWFAWGRGFVTGLAVGLALAAWFLGAHWQ